jgi:hypothetical protein
MNKDLIYAIDFTSHQFIIYKCKINYILNKGEDVARIAATDNVNNDNVIMYICEILKTHKEKYFLPKNCFNTIDEAKKAIGIEAKKWIDKLINNIKII